jgi:hypothetical protein
MSEQMKQTMMLWVVEALEENQGSGTIPEVCKHIWDNHEEVLRESGDDFYTWQYTVRWAKQALRENGNIQPPEMSPKGVWVLTTLN